MTNYQPVFKYKREFDPEDGESIYIKVDTEFETKDKKIVLTLDKQKVRMFNSNNVKELIYTFFKFNKAAKDLEMKGKDMQKHFLKLLGQDARSRYNDMMEDREKIQW